MIFGDLFNRPKFAQDAKNFAAICKSPFEKTPTLDDFLAKKNIPQVVISVTPTPIAAPVQYLSAYPVLDAANYSICLRYVGDKVELIGQIVEVKQDITRRGKPYVFINFGPWQGNIVKINFWSEGLSALSKSPDQGWVGKWISVVGLLEPPYVSKRFKYSHVAISITQGNQLHLITEKEAKFRLAGSSTRSSAPKSPRNNREILKEFRAGTASGPRIFVPTQTAPATSNQAILQCMKGSQPSQQTSYQGAGSYSASPPPTKSFRSRSNCFIATTIYGTHAPETNALREWRDRVLLPRTVGRAVVYAYYKISPKLIPFVERSPWLTKSVKRVLDRIVAWIR